MKAGDSSSKSRGLDKGGITEGLQGHPLDAPGVVASCYDFCADLVDLDIFTGAGDTL